ncbi:DUF1501 domain-containing protein [soil metagenome]
MLNIRSRPRLHDGKLTRRQLLQAGGTGLFGMNLPALLAAEKASGSTKPRARSVMFLFQFGGPSQLETFDMKPAAPEKIRGPFKPIASRTPGLRICEHLPRLAEVSDKYCVLRTLTHNFNDHSGAGHYLQTGKRWHLPIGGGFNATAIDWPSMGSMVEFSDRQKSSKQREMPSYVVVPNSLGRLEESGQYKRPGEYAGWLGRTFNPLTTTVDKKNLQDNPYWRDCTDQELTFQIEGLISPQELSPTRIRNRQSLLEQLDGARRSLERGSFADLDSFRQEALTLVTSGAARRALDIREESPQLRDRYGRHLFGQSCLMGRRLVEAGARFVTVHYDCCDGYSWDSHLHSDDLRKHLLPTFDQGLAALLTDLEDRGLLDETLVVAVGEMGRTPQATPQWGRGHWSTLFPAVLAGAGIRPGTTFGASDKDAAYPIDHPTSPEDLAATIYHALGIDPEMRLRDPQGREVSLVDGGKPVLDLFG